MHTLHATVEPRGTLWTPWAAIVAALALDAWAIAAWLPVRLDVWYDAEIYVARFVLGLLALVTAVGTFALRESLVLHDLRSGALDPNTEGGLARIRRKLAALWLLCGGVAVYGNVLAWGSARLTEAVPFLLAAALLLVLHAPRSALFRRPAG
jgi:hypothetical protein